MKIFYSKPSITEKEIAYVGEAALAMSGEGRYAYIDEFEKQFRSYLGTEFSIATSSCTGAINLALASIGLKAGDEVILADINWIASAVPITYFGAKPVFVDILRDTWCIDPSKIEEAITPRTKAIIAVHLYGNLAEMDLIMEIAKKHGLFVIEDAAEALGAEYRGRKAGSIGDVGVFSFHATKMCTCGEGGMLVSNRPDVMEATRILNDHGRNPKIKKMFFPDRLGYKFKMSSMQAAMGVAQMERITELLGRKIEIFNEYRLRLCDIPAAMNPDVEGMRNSYWMPTIVFDKSLEVNRDLLLDTFRSNSIDARAFFYPLSMLPMFNEVRGNTVAYDIFGRAINLPSYHDLTNIDIEYVCNTLKNFLSQTCSL